MSRMDYKRGRFNPDFETDQIFEGMRGWQSIDGDWVNYYRFDEAQSEIHPIYDEPTGDGLKWIAPVRVEALHVTHVEGGNEDSDRGFYYNDDLDVVVPFDLFIQAGMEMADINTGNYLKDRIVYDRKVFRIKTIAIRGQMQQRDIIVGITGTQLKPDELVWDTQFADWAPGGAFTLQGGTQ
jgi:hypothetical protein